jgi:hypothetical protein
MQGDTMATTFIDVRHTETGVRGEVSEAALAIWLARGYEVIADDGEGNSVEVFPYVKSIADLAGRITVEELLAALGGGIGEASAEAVATFRAALVGGAPELLNTLDELAAAIGDDPTFAATLTTQLGLKQPKATLSTDLVAKLANPADTFTISVDARQLENLSDPTSPVRTELDSTYASIFTPPVIDTDYPSLEAALAAVPDYGTLEIRGAWTRTTTFTVNKPSIVRFARGGGIAVTAANIVGITVASDFVTIYDPNLTGNTSSATGTASAIRCEGTAAKPYDSVAVLGSPNTWARLKRWSYAAIYLINVTNWTIDSIKITDIAYAGVLVSSGIHGRVERCTITNITQPSGYVNSYGIAVTHNSGLSPEMAPRSDDFVINDNIVDGVPLWEGIDTHGGKNFHVTNNRVKNARVAIALVPGPRSGVNVDAPENFYVAGNDCDSGRTDGGGSTLGMNVSGSSSAVGFHNVIAYATGKIIGNTFRGFGEEVAASGSAMNFRNTSGIIVQANNFTECAVAAIRMDYNNRDMVIDGNTATDIWANTAIVAAFLTTGSGFNTATVTGNKVLRGAKIATRINLFGLRPNTSVATQFIDSGNNFGTATTTPYVGNDYLFRYDVRGVRHALVTAAPTMGVWERGSRLDLSTPSASTSDGWRCVTSGGVASLTWAAATAYTAGVTGQWAKTASGKVLECIVGGTSGSIEPTPTTLGEVIVDGTAQWIYRAATVAAFKANAALAA